METKIFRIPSECTNLIPYFWDLKQEACEELRRNGIDQEPAQTKLEELQKICDKRAEGALTKYVRELKKGFRMNKEEIMQYNQKLQDYKKPISKNEQSDVEISDDQDMDGISADFDSFGGAADFDETLSFDFDDTEEKFINSQN